MRWAEPAGDERHFVIRWGEFTESLCGMVSYVASGDHMCEGEQAFQCLSGGSEST